MSWSFVAAQRTPVHGGRDFPSVRYSAAAVQYRGEMIVTHGYFYNHAIRHPAWQSNAWAFNFASQRWRKIHEGEQAGAPSARYSTSAVLYDNALWMFGGDDGGHKTSMFNYIFQSWYKELWRFDLRTYSWSQVKPMGAAPAKRALHSAVVIGDSMYVYGGLELADTWRYDFGPKTWTLVVPPPADTHTKDGSHPGRRHAFAAAATANGFYIFGGCRHVRLPACRTPACARASGASEPRPRRPIRQPKRPTAPADRPPCARRPDATRRFAACVRSPSTTCGTSKSATAAGLSWRLPWAATA